TAKLTNIFRELFVCILSPDSFDSQGSSNVPHRRLCERAISVLVLGYHRVLERHDAVECGLLERNLEKELQHPSRTDLLAAWKRHDFGAEIASSSDSGAHTRYEHLPAFGGEDGRDDEVAYRAKRPTDHAVEARLLRCPLAQVHAIVWHLVGIVHALGDVLVELLLAAPREAVWNVDNGNGHG